MYRVNVRERFGQVGTTRYLMGQYGIDAPGIVAAVQQVLARKN